MTIPPEEEIIKGCIDGNRKYQELLYLKYSRKMMGVCYRYSQKKEEAEDILQESFIKIFSRLNQFRHEGSLEGWIRKIVLSTIYDNFRKKKFMVVLTDSIADEVTDTRDLFTETDFDHLINAIRELSPGYRTVFNMYAVEGYTHKEIGELLGISTGTSKSQYSAARKSLQKKLNMFENKSSLNTK
jgi:RNA polymerase sigma factor (sigma-70 family)